ncbi:hypothetical protein RZS08_53670, partial [Arthrospira platensis SPKY1]|nr:hypothetical protein [Arthrospira platensis SPKY1]
SLSFYSAFYFFEITKMMLKMDQLIFQVFGRESDAFGHVFLKKVVDPVPVGQYRDEFLDNGFEDPFFHRPFQGLPT